MNYNKMVLASTKTERIIHWFLAGSLILLFITGSALAFQFLNFIQPVFGGPYAMKFIHHLLGLVFFISLLPILIIWIKDCLFEADDFKWLIKAGGYIIRTDDVPPLAKFNAGQKIFFWYTLFFGLMASITGYIMLYPADFTNSALIQWSYPLHVLAYGMFGIGWLGHWYLGVYANPGSLATIISGWIPKDWIDHHRAKWPVKEVKVILYGKLTDSILDGLKKKMNEFVPISWNTMTLDFKQVTAIDESPLHFLVSYIKSADKKGKLIISKANADIAEILKKAGLGKYIK